MATHSLYLGNKMTDIPYFNAPWFDMAHDTLLAIPTVGQVFNPAEHDRDQGFDPMQCPHGSKEESQAAGFNVREALAADWEWIAKYSTGMVVGPDWRMSPGARSEVACHQALGLPVWEFHVFCKHWCDRRLLKLTLPMVISMPTLLLPDDEDDEDGSGLVCDCHG